MSLLDLRRDAYARAVDVFAERVGADLTGLDGIADRLDVAVEHHNDRLAGACSKCTPRRQSTFTAALSELERAFDAADELPARAAAVLDDEIALPDTRSLAERVASIPAVELPEDTRPRRPKSVGLMACHPVAAANGSRRLIGIPATPAR
jgi:hypothetical protein